MLDVKRTEEGLFYGTIGRDKVLGTESKNETVTRIRTVEALQTILDMDARKPSKGDIIEFNGDKFTLLDCESPNFLMVIAGIGDYDTNFFDQAGNNYFGLVQMLPTPKGCKYTFNEFLDVQYSVLPEDLNNSAIVVSRSVPCYELELIPYEKTETKTDTDSGATPDSDEIPF